MKKKLIIVLLAIVASLCLAFGIAGCTSNGESSDNDNSNSGNNTEQTTPDDNISGTEHTHSYTSAVTTQPTCTEDGVITYTCTCGDSYTEAIPATEHTESSEITENYVAATCTETGSYDKVVYCTECETVLSRETVTVAATEHNYSEWEKADDKTHQRECEVCGDVQSDTHNFNDNVCTVCGYTLEYIYGLKYTLSSNGTYYTVAGIGTATATDIVIPSTYNGLPVTTIAASAFKNCTSLNSIVVPDSVTSIGIGAFSGCSSLQSITLPFVGGNSSATSASSSTLFGYIFGTSSYTGGTSTKQYYSSSSYKTYYIPRTLANVTITGGNILYGAFYNCSKLTIITLPDGLSSIGNWALAGCSSLTIINIPDSVTSIGEYAFVYCTAEINWDVDPKITEIGDYAFAYYVGAIITIPDSVSSIGEGAFIYCTAEINWDVDPKITEIGDYAFIGYAGTSITIPDSVTSIGSDAFYGCHKLVEVYNLSSLSITAGSSDNGYVAGYAKNVYSLEEESNLLTTEDGFIIYADDDTREYYLMGYVGSSTDITLPERINGHEYEIYRYAFWHCSSLTSIIIPDGVTSIGSFAFYRCTSLTSVTIGNGVTTIGMWAFAYCTSLTSITIPDNVTSIGGGAFDGCTSLTSIIIPDGVTSIGSFAFYGCTSLTSITIPDSVTSIGNYAFDGCTSLTSITIPSSVTSIGYQAFYNCSKLTSVTFENAESWWISISSTATSGTSFSSTSLKDPSTAAIYLRSTYASYYWKRG